VRGVKVHWRAWEKRMARASEKKKIAGGIEAGTRALRGATGARENGRHDNYRNAHGHEHACNINVRVCVCVRKGVERKIKE
jgi:hypothetical protein